MDSFAKTLWVGGGGFVGANLRYWMGEWIRPRLGGSFPWDTLLINLAGSLVIGLFMGLFVGSEWHPSTRLFVAVGILGGFTTYSSFAYESVRLMGDRQFGLALAYVSGSALGTVACAALGLALAQKLANLLG